MSLSFIDKTDNAEPPASRCNTQSVSTPASRGYTPGEQEHLHLFIGAPLAGIRLPRTKKADVAEHPQAFDHVGLLVNKPPGKAELLFI